MKKTKLKLILNSNSYRIYTDNGIEYCRFKKKYYPLTEIENVINSYKIGGVKSKNKTTDKLELPITERIELAEKIIKLLKEQEIPKIYAYYLYFKISKDTQEEIIEKIQTEILEPKYKKYEDICEAVNRLMIYLTDTAKDIKDTNYTDETLCDEYNIYFKSLVFTPQILDAIESDTDTAKQTLTKSYIKALNKELPTLFANIKNKNKYKELLGIKGGDNNYKTAIDNIFNYTESSDESDILYDSDISEESIISIRSDYSEDLITPLLTPQT
jgi:DNA-binding transcriptional MerR regulator